MSKLEDQFLEVWRKKVEQGELPEQQYSFCDERKWKFDFAWPRLMVAVEMEGGIYSKGGHVRGRLYHDNCCKYNQAISMGWRVLRFTTDHLRNEFEQEQMIATIFDTMNLGRRNLRTRQPTQRRKDKGR